MHIATTILEQLGGNMFATMTGAKSFLSIESGLTFRLPSNFASKGINCVRITLTPADLYDVEFLKIRGVKMTTIAKVEGIYCEMLRQTFTDATGLDTSMGRIRGEA